MNEQEVLKTHSLIFYNNKVKVIKGTDIVMSQNKEKVPVSIKLVTEIRDGARKEHTVTEAKGMLYEKETATIFSYTEEMDGAGKVNNILKVKENEVFIMRSGAVSMRQMLQKGETTTGTYESMYGTMDMETKTENIRFHPQLNSGKLLVTYQLAMQGQQVGRHRLTLTYKKVKNDREV